MAIQQRAFRSAKHDLIGAIQQRIVVGQKPVTHQCTRALLRCLNALYDKSLNVCCDNKHATLEVQVCKCILQVDYNFKSPTWKYYSKQYIRQYNTKLRRKFLEARVIGKFKPIEYMLEDQGTFIPLITFSLLPSFHEAQCVSNLI